VLAPARAVSDVSFEDGFGRRTRSVDLDTGDEIELLELSASLVEHNGFVAALSERVVRVANARHASYARVRRLDRPAADRLVLVSDSLPGWRLSELLRVASEERLVVETTVVIGLLRQLLPAVALFARNNRESAIGNLAPERLLVTPQARLVITEHAFGLALEKLSAARDRLWREFRVAVGPGAGHPRIDSRADAHAMGIIALSLMMGRSLAVDEYPAKLQALVEVLRERKDGATAPLTTGMEHWLLRALQLDSRAAFQSPQEAHLAFESMLASERSYVTTPTALEAFVAKVGALLDKSRTPAAPPPPAMPEPALRLVDTSAPVPVSGRMNAATAPSVAPPISATAAPALSLVPPPPALVPAPLSKQDPAPAVVVAPENSVDSDAPVAASPEKSESLSPFSLSRASLLASEESPEPVGVITQPTNSLLGQTSAPHSASTPVTRSSLALTLVALAMLQSGVLMYLWSHPPGAAANGQGELVIQSRPTSARVIIDGEDRGVTPATVRLPAGAHVLEIRVGSSDSRVIPVTINAGMQTAQYIELQNVPHTGGVDLRSEPPGAKVSVDGQKRGATPVRITDLPPGDHEILFDSPAGSIKQSVHIDAGVTTQVTVRLPVR
jgi:hypothetical protein